MTLRNLHGDWEIVCCFGREEYIDCFLLEGWVGRLVSDLDYMELHVSLHSYKNDEAYSSACCCPDGKGKQLGRLSRTVYFQSSECRRMSLDRLGNPSFDRIKL